MDVEYLTVEHLSTKDLIRVFSKISTDPNVQWGGTPCWQWKSTLVHGYPHIWWPKTGKHERCHRVVFAWLVAPVPRRVTGQKTPNLDHLCRRKHCVNPCHLELVPPRVNTLRGDTLAARNAAKTLCPQGHSLQRKDESERYCPICRKENEIKRRPLNADRRRKSSQKYREKNLEKLRLRDRLIKAAQRVADPKKANAYRRAYRQRNLEHARAQDRIRYLRRKAQRLAS